MATIDKVFDKVIESFAFDDNLKQGVVRGLAIARPEIDALHGDLLLQRYEAQKQADRSRNGSGWDEATYVVSVGIFDL